MMIYEKYKADIELFKEMMEIGYPQYIAPILQFGGRFKRYYGFYEDAELKDYLEWLNKNQVVLHTSDDKNMFIRKMNVKHDGHLLKSRNSLNSMLAEKRYGYIINEKDCKFEGKRHRHSWIVEKCNAI